MSLCSYGNRETCWEVRERREVKSMDVSLVAPISLVPLVLRTSPVMNQFPAMRRKMLGCKT